MTENVQRIEYRQGMIETRKKAGTLPVRIWNGAEIPDEVQEAITIERLADLGGTYGDPKAGDPIEYDHLTLAFPSGVTKIEVFNRGILLFLTNDERTRRIHRVLCKLNKAATTA